MDFDYCMQHNNIETDGYSLSQGVLWKSAFELYFFFWLENPGEVEDVTEHDPGSP